MKSASGESYRRPLPRLRSRSRTFRLFYADLGNSDRYLPVSAISNTMRDTVVGRGLVTARMRVAIDLTLTVDAGHATVITRMLAGECFAEFPVIWRCDGRGIRFILKGGFGFFTDGNPRFGNPDAITLGSPRVENPAAGAATGSRIIWFENLSEGGIDGATQM